MRRYRYSILVKENHRDAREVELCQCNGNPEAIVAAARNKTQQARVRGRMTTVARYTHVRVVDHGVPELTENGG